MSEMTLKKYYENHFPERPEKNLQWKYKLRDMLDEWLKEFALIVIFVLAYWYSTGDVWKNLAFYGGITVCGGFAAYLFGIIFLRRVCMKFYLTPDHFEFTHGLFKQKVQTFQLSDIIEIDLRRSVWERIIHTGTIIIRFKNGTSSQTNPLIIRGIGKYKEMFDRIDYYRNHHRLVLYFGI